MARRHLGSHYRARTIKKTLDHNISRDSRLPTKRNIVSDRHDSLWYPVLGMKSQCGRNHANDNHDVAHMIHTGLFKPSLPGQLATHRRPLDTVADNIVFAPQISVSSAVAGTI